MSEQAQTLALCVPAYNAESFLGRLLSGATEQSVPFDEIWVYDDASKDGTSELARKFGANVVRGEKNVGCSAGKNILAARCSSTWLHFHDADDALEPNFVENARRWMTAGGPDVVFFGYRSLNHVTGEPMGTRDFDGAALRENALKYCLTEQINPFCGIYRKEPFMRVGGWDEDRAVLQSEDQAGHLRMSAGGLHFDADPARTVINYIREGSMTTSNLPGAQRSTYEVMRKAAGMVAPSYHDIIAGRLWSTAGQSAAFGDWENADRSALLASKLSKRIPASGGSGWFRRLAGLSPRLALRLRERLIRTLRPADRVHPVFHQEPARKSA